jgi:hypothetical protein
MAEATMQIAAASEIALVSGFLIVDIEASSIRLWFEA